MSNFEIQTVTGQKVRFENATVLLNEDAVIFKRGEDVVGYVPTRQLSFFGCVPAEAVEGQSPTSSERQRARDLLRDAGSKLDAALILLKKAAESR